MEKNRFHIYIEKILVNNIHKLVKSIFLDLKNAFCMQSEIFSKCEQMLP